MVETVRHEMTGKRAQDLRHVSERTNANRNDDTAGAKSVAIVKAKDKLVAAPFDGVNLHFRSWRTQRF